MMLAGWTTTPGEVCDALTANNGFTNGLAIWDKVTQAFPYFRFDGGPFRIAQGYNAASDGSHWWAIGLSGAIYDPWTGDFTHPAGYPATGYANGVSCDYPPSISLTSAPVSIAVVSTFSPFLSDLSPSQEYNAEVARMQRYLTNKGKFVDAGPQDGWYGSKTAKAIHDFQVSNGLTQTTEYGWWYPLTRSFANQDLLITNNA